MARLRNRIVKADINTDPELLRWHRDKRYTYQKIWQMAEDSGCLEDDPFGWKLTAWPSPLDADITVEVLTRWRDELVEAKKLIPYKAEGKDYLYIKTFHQHEHPRNPQPNDLPLPPWVTFVYIEVPRSDGRKNKVYRYDVNEALLPALYRCSVVDEALESQKLGTESVPTRYRLRTESPVRSSPVRSRTNLSEGSAASGDSPVDNFSEEDEPDAFADIDFGEEEDEPEVKAKDLVAFYVAETKRVCRSVPKQKDIDAVAGIVADRLKAGRDPDMIKAAIRKLIVDGKPPGILKTLIEEAFQTAPRDTSAKAPPLSEEEREAGLAVAREGLERLRSLGAQRAAAP
jgi:hypothetical protein